MKQVSWSTAQAWKWVFTRELAYVILLGTFLKKPLGETRFILEKNGVFQWIS